MMGLGDTILKGCCLSFHRLDRIDLKSPVKFNFVQVFFTFCKKHANTGSKVQPINASALKLGLFKKP